MRYQPTAASVSQHPLPEWFDDAKLGIFIHWGLFSVPAWAPPCGEVTKIVKEQGWKAWFTNNAYAEWYLNTMRIEGSPTALHHAATYGHIPYEGFVPMFNEAARKWNPIAMAGAIKNAGAQYVVLVTKHHDGFTLWPSGQHNPYKSGYHAERDIVGELSTAVRAAGMTMGLYYSGGLDWTFKHPVITDIADLIACIPQSQDYIAYADGQWRELIERYQPAVLWDDIGYPQAADVPRLFADYYNRCPEGLINDRFVQHKLGGSSAQFWSSPLGRWLLGRLAGHGIKHKMSAKPRVANLVHYDFSTPEYATHDQIMPYKWEATRGLGFSFGYNRDEGPEKTLSVRELVHFLVDVVSKNGNLLLNIGPMADGAIPPIQMERLEGLGAWLKANGQAIYGTRPWITAEGVTEGGLQVRFTRRAETLYAILLGAPGGTALLHGLQTAPGSVVRLLDWGQPLTWVQEEHGLRVVFPPNLTESPAYSLAISPLPSLHPNSGVNG
ncbi:MAG: alpha-L-fucosidase [Chloroflexi bacterium]|nr:alpha-L-fucosidase [Chloroflexota bacterium]